MQSIFSSRTSAVLLNGVPRKTFHCKRGVRQGDPLSSLLFVLAVDFLQSMINKAKDLGLLNLPILTLATNDFPVIQYANDTLTVVEGDVRHLFFFKSLLNSFSLTTGLKVNFNKSMMVPIMFHMRSLISLLQPLDAVKGVCHSLTLVCLCALIGQGLRIFYLW
jgi:hypothetical protein